MTWAAIKVAILAWFARWAGQRQGRADQRQADIAAGEQQRIKTDEAINRADATAPVDRSGVAQRLRDGTF